MLKDLGVIYGQYGLVAVISIVSTIIIGYALRLATSTSAHVIAGAVKDLELARAALREELTHEVQSKKELAVELRHCKEMRSEQAGRIRSLENRIRDLEYDIDELLKK